MKKKLQSVAIFKKTPIFVLRRCSSAYCIVIKKLSTTDCCMKKIGINIQLFLFFTTCNAVISKILFPSIFYVKKHVPAMNVLHNTRFLTFLIITQISSIQLPKKTLWKKWTIVFEVKTFSICKSKVKLLKNSINRESRYKLSKLSF